MRDATEVALVVCNKLMATPMTDPPEPCPHCTIIASALAEREREARIEERQWLKDTLGYLVDGSPEARPYDRALVDAICAINERDAALKATATGERLAAASEGRGKK